MHYWYLLDKAVHIKRKVFLVACSCLGKAMVMDVNLVYLDVELTH